MTANQWAAVIFAGLWLGIATPAILYCVWRDASEKEARRRQ